MKISTLVLIFILSISSLLAQNDTPFTAQQKVYAKGNSVLIGNTILGKHPQNAFNEVKTLNDQVPLNFVDIDEDDTTFSSSKASFTLPVTTKKIKYAGLYWGGLYPAQSSSRSKGKRRIKYDYLGERDERVQEVRLKINDADYEDVLGQIIFDSQAKGPFARESPYACFADVTPQMAKLKNEISITVANIRATTGFIEGGAAAGWLLYVVYEDDSQTPKYFTSYTGFKEVSKDEVEVVFEELQPKNENTTSSKIMMATLEGDTRIKGDACAIYSDLEELFIPLTTEGRPANNFFNSTVSVGNDIPMTRTPESKNTLGFDLLKMNVPDNTITANTTDAIIRLSTKQDRFYTFFLAFETEIEEIVLEEQILASEVAEDPKDVKSVPVAKNTAVTVAGPPPVFTSPLPVAASQTTVKEGKNVPIENEVVSEKTKTEVTKEPTFVEKRITPVVKSANEEAEKMKNELAFIKRRASLTSDGMLSGYYLITNVFKNKEYALRWKNRLNDEGYNARTFINSTNQRTYVYIESSNNPEKMVRRKEIIRQIPHLKNTWVCRLNQ